MVYKEVFFRSTSLIILFVFIGLTPLVSANFVCGEVSSSEEISASWFSVSLWYSDNPEDRASCLVSPENARFCCDPLEIEGSSWQVGKEISARIFDSEIGYFTEPVSVVISGEGFDVLPSMDLRNAVTISDPNTSVLIDASEIFIAAQSDLFFNELFYELYYGNELISSGLLCEDCSEGDATLTLPEYGSYSLTIAASNDAGDVMSETVTFSNLEYVLFSRTISCDGCEGDFVPRNSLVTMNVSVETSHEVSGVFADYFPVEWVYIESIDGVDADFDENGVVGTSDLLFLLGNWGVCGPESCPGDLNGDGVVGDVDVALVIVLWSSDEPPPEDVGGTSTDELLSLLNEGSVEPYSETHNRITWDFEGSFFERTYLLVSPNSLFSEGFLFFSTFDDFFGNEFETFLNRFFLLRLLLPTPERSVLLPSDSQTIAYGQISQTQPLVIPADDTRIVDVTVFPTSRFKDVSGTITYDSPTRLSRSAEHFSVHASIPSTMIDRVLIRFAHSVDSTEETRIYSYDSFSDEWEELEMRVYGQDASYVYYESYALRTGSFAITTTEESA